MQATHLTTSQAAEVLAEAVTLTRLEWPGASRTHVLEVNGRDVLMIQDSLTGDAIVIDACDYDSESGGSIHDHARAMTSDVA